MGKSPRQPKTAKLRYDSLPTYSPDPPGLATPPLRPPAAIPFLWEEEPGKPKVELVPTLDEEGYDQVVETKTRTCLTPPPTAVYRLVYPTVFDRPSVLMGPSSLSFREGFGSRRRRRRRGEWLVWSSGRGGRSGSVTSDGGRVEGVGRRHSCFGNEREGSFRFYIGEVVRDGGGGEEEVAAEARWRKERRHGIRVSGISSAITDCWVCCSLLGYYTLN